MKVMKSVGVLRLALIAAATAGIIGVFAGIAGFFVVGSMGNKADSSLKSVMSFLTHEDNIDAFGGMAVGIARYAALESDMEQARFAEMFPENEEATSLKEIHSVAGTFLADTFGMLKLLILFGLPFGMAFMGFAVGGVGGLVYNRIGGIPIELDEKAQA